MKKRTAMRITCLVAMAICLFGSNQRCVAEDAFEILAFENPPTTSPSILGEGLGVELMKAAFQEVGVRPILNYLPLKRVVKMMQDQEAPALLGNNLYFTEEEKAYLPVTPLILSRFVFVYYKPTYPEGIRYDTFEDLRPYIIGVRLGSNAGIPLKKANLNVQETSTIDGMFKQLQSNRINLLVTLDLTVPLTVRTLFPEEEANFVILPKPLQEYWAGMVFNTNIPEGVAYQARLTEGIEKIKRNGTYLKIYEKYYGAGNVPQTVLDFINLPNKGDSQ